MYILFKLCKFVYNLIRIVTTDAFFMRKVFKMQHQRHELHITEDHTIQGLTVHEDHNS